MPVFAVLEITDTFYATLICPVLKWRKLLLLSVTGAGIFGNVVLNVIVLSSLIPATPPPPRFDR